MNRIKNETSKICWEGSVEAIQPRTRVWRYVTDNRNHYYLGYNIFLKSVVDNTINKFSIAVSSKQQEKLQLRIGDHISGTAWSKKYKKREFADYYRAGSLKFLERDTKNPERHGPPWAVIPPSLKMYKQRGARILSKSRWKSKCFTCIWANMANVEIQWDFDKDIKKYRFESFCYGPKSCNYYKMGKPPLVPYKNRGSFPDNGILDDIFTNHRADDE